MRIFTGLAVALLAALAAGPAQAATFHVRAGDSIQTAVDRARSGDTVLVHPGTYRERGRSCTGGIIVCAVEVKRSGIRLKAASTSSRPVVLARTGRQKSGIIVGRTAKPRCLTNRRLRLRDILVSGFTVRGFPEDGIDLYCTEDWRVTRVRTTGNREYGVFPVLSGKGRLDHSFASGANDTGFYVGQSHDVRMDHNVATGNLSGYEVENSTDVQVDHNTATGNTAGILSFALPGLPVKVNRDNVIESNDVRENNKANPCKEPGDVVCGVPKGSGILLIAADGNVVRDNTVRSNDTFGIGVANYCIIRGGAPDCEPGFDSVPDRDRVEGNTAQGNAGDPAPDFAAVAADLAWDTSGSGNCWAGNTFDKTFPSSLPSC